ncbi:MAG TPA: 50S ribosomal protein L21 [Candidatus Hydrogenedentes bacterium]|nr:50S ribosomal protein L21 [Candidatus Hydrogenedentota bacterium]HNT88783.1 50S ribosomal protein L21 [Candidatus Hydrogenedentota bacterium]
MYAVVNTGGKQYKMAVGDTVRVEKIDAAEGDTVELDQVALIATDDAIVTDPAALAAAKVVCRVVEQDRAKKIRVFKYKKRKNYHKTRGHRQYYTALRVQDIQA